MERTRETAVKEFVADDHRAAAVFEKYAIDYCCHGGTTLEAACAGRGVRPEQILAELEQVGNPEEADGGSRVPEALDDLVDHIVERHHRFVRIAVPAINAHLDRLVVKHGSRHGELAVIREEFHRVGDELDRHMRKEELVLFPYIKELVRVCRSGLSCERPTFGTIRNPISMMEAEHRSAGSSFVSIREASNGLVAPADGCTTYALTYRELDEFERDLHRHIHLENNILFPHAIQLEEEVLSRT